MQHEVALVPDQIEDAAEVDPLQRRDAVMVLCGVRDVHDYRIRSSAENAVVGGGSAFNVRAESLRLGDFTEPEVRALLAQHTAETGQAFTEVFRKNPTIRSWRA